MGTTRLLPGQPDPKMDPKFRSGSFPAVVTFGLKGVGPPSPLYIQRDDQLFIQAVTNSAPDTVFFNGRLLLAPAPRAGQPDTAAPVDLAALEAQLASINLFTEQVALSANFAETTLIRALAEGYLLSLSAVGLNTFSRGTTFVRALLIRGGTQERNIVLPLFSDYVSAITGVGWPGGRNLMPIEGPGFVHSRQLANPLAGVDWSFTAGTGQRLRVISLAATLTTAAAVANRNVELIVDDGVNTLWITDASASVLAGTTQQFAATGTNVPTGVVTTIAELVIPPDLILQPGWRLRTNTVNIQAADQWSNIWANVEEYIEFL